MLSTQDWKCHKCQSSGSIIILGKTQVQIIYEIAEQHNFKSPKCGTISMILLDEDKPENNMKTKKCYWCSKEIGNGNLETREKRLQYFCSLSHIKKWAELNIDGDLVLNIKVFVAGKFIGRLIEFEIE